MSETTPPAAVIGIGSTRFGVHTASTRALVVDAVDRALRDAEIETSQVDAVYYGYSVTGLVDGQESCLGQLALRDLGITGIPITRVENACSSSAAALNVAVQAVRGGEADVVLVFGAERIAAGGTAAAITALAGASDQTWEGQEGLTFPGTFGMIAQRHMLDYGTTRAQIAGVAVKNHRHASLNDEAHLPYRVTLEDVLDSKPVADPLRLLDCCPVSDGATALIVASPRVAHRFVDRPIWIRASVLASGVYDERSPITSFAATRRAAEAAYERSGCGPEDLSLAEVHDCFTIAEIVHYEDLGFVARGQGGRFVEEGHSALGGRLPVNVSGGLKAKGHPVGATGAGQVIEVVKQLRGTAGPRQVEGATLGLTHCMGGFFHGDAGSVAIHVLSA